jgi:lipopolysaccharide export system protein LptC
MSNASGITSGLDDGQRMASPRRHEAFVAARRHSRRVSRLKIAVVLLCLAAAAGLIGVAFFNPLAHLPRGVSIVGSTLSGTKITMDHPRLNGFRRDGSPYQLLASSGVQDIRTPSIVELNDIDANLTMPDSSVMKLQAPQGIYDTTKDRMRITRTLHVTDPNHYHAELQSADLDFKAGSVVSADPVTVVTTSSTIAADSIDITENGDKIVFQGQVRSTLARPDELRGSAP